MAPLIFTKLDEVTAGKFIRTVFPWYYLVIIFFAALGAGCLFVSHEIECGILLIIAIGGIFARQVLMPKINHYRDLMIQGEEAAERTFKRLHSFSVWINSAQLLAGIATLTLLSWQ